MEYRENERKDGVITDLIATICKDQTNNFTKCHPYVLFCVLGNDSGINGEPKSSPEQRQAAFWRVLLAVWAVFVDVAGGGEG